MIQQGIRHLAGDQAVSWSRRFGGDIMIQQVADSADAPSIAPAWGTGPLTLEGWLEFNRKKWGVTPHVMKWQQSGKEHPALGAVLYLDSKGRVTLPPLHPYLALEFMTAPHVSRYKAYSQWLNLSESLIAELRTRGMSTTLRFPAQFQDMRPLQWAGYKVGVAYTYCVEFPYERSAVEGSVRNAINKSLKLGYRCERTRNMRDVFACLKGTEERQRFSHQLSEEDLHLLVNLIGEEQMRTYICYAPNGEPASAQVILHRAGAQALGWIAGSREAHYRNGVNQLMEHFTIQDLQTAGAIGYDLAGANIRSVAATKMKWGAQLVSYSTVQAHGIKSHLREIRNWWRMRMNLIVGGLGYACADHLLLLPSL